MRAERGVQKAFSVAAPVLPLLMKESICCTAFAE
jgi:hypothetical protein